MRMFTNNEQTAKLIELGFEKPKGYHDIEWDGTEAYDYHLDYSIGELIEMLPMYINNDGRFEDLIIHPNFHRWVVKYLGFVIEPTYQICMKELIDALYYMIIKLKEEGVI